MAPITSDCDAMRTHEHQTALITSECAPVTAAVAPGPAAAIRRRAARYRADAGAVGRAGRARWVRATAARAAIMDCPSRCWPPITSGCTLGQAAAAADPAVDEPRGP